MEKRGLKIGTYDTVAHQWLLTGLELSAPEQVTNYVSVPGRRKGPLDLSTALTDGDPVYGSRTLTATFESSEGDRMAREDRIRQMFSLLDGLQRSITMPDDPGHYLVGRVHIERLYNDMAHASVRVTAVCEPWRYNNAETVVVFQAAPTSQTGRLFNPGRLFVVPSLTISGGPINFGSGYGTITTGVWTLSEGEYILPETFLTSGINRWVYYFGTGTLTFRYREAVL